MERGFADDGRMEPYLGYRIFPGMSISLRRHHRGKDDIDFRDRLIHSLYISLRAERETRDTIVEAARAGASAEVIEALASDPIPPIDPPGQAETVRALLRHQKGVDRPSAASVIDA